MHQGSMIRQDGEQSHVDILVEVFDTKIVGQHLLVQLGVLLAIWMQMQHISQNHPPSGAIVWPPHHMVTHHMPISVACCHQNG